MPPRPPPLSVLASTRCPGLCRSLPASVAPAFVGACLQAIERLGSSALQGLHRRLREFGIRHGPDAHQHIPAQHPRQHRGAGGGPAGLEAARIAAERGHHVTLFDKESKLGGQLIPASIAPMKQEIVILTKHLVLQAKKAGVKIILNEEVTAETVQRLQPDVVIDATGGVPLVPNVAGLDNANVVKAWDVLNGLVTTGRNAVVIGGGQTGCEVADFLAHPIQDMTPYGTNVTLLQRAPNIALQELSSFRSTLVQRMLKKGVKIIAGAEALEFSDNAVRYAAGGEEHVITGVDTIVVGTGTKPNLALSEALKASGVKVHMIGDVNGPRQVAEAVREAAELARGI